MKPHLNILPKAQMELWPQLAELNNQFILYGGTAVALQLGHRQSIDFDFFIDEPLTKEQLLQSAAFLKKVTIVQPSLNTFNCFYSTSCGDVKLQFLAGLGERQKRVEKPVRCEDNGLQLASLRDLLGTKLNTIQARAEKKDYIDIHAMLVHGLNLSDGLACAKAIYGENFDPGTTLRALSSYRDGDLEEINPDIKNYLIKMAMSVDDIPMIKPI